MAYFGSGNGRIWLVDVGCAGTETDLTYCTSSHRGDEICGHYEDAGVICQDGIYKYIIINIL